LAIILDGVLMLKSWDKASGGVNEWLDVQYRASSDHQLIYWGVRAFKQPLQELLSNEEMNAKMRLPKLLKGVLDSHLRPWKCKLNST